MEDEQDCIIERKDTKHTSDVEVTKETGGGHGFEENARNQEPGRERKRHRLHTRVSHEEHAPRRRLAKSPRMPSSARMWDNPGFLVIAETELAWPDIDQSCGQGSDGAIVEWRSIVPNAAGRPLYQRFRPFPFDRSTVSTLAIPVVSRRLRAGSEMKRKEAFTDSVNGLQRC
jgi:hypothetical protein